MPTLARRITPVRRSSFSRDERGGQGAVDDREECREHVHGGGKPSCRLLEFDVADVDRRPGHTFQRRRRASCPCSPTRTCMAPGSRASLACCVLTGGRAPRTCQGAKGRPPAGKLLVCVTGGASILMNIREISTARVAA
jgi:hypothetical protein